MSQTQLISYISKTCVHVSWHGRSLVGALQISAAGMQALLAWVGSFLSLLLIGGMQQWINQHWSIPLLLATFGPAAALVFGLPSLPASQPLNCFGECHMIRQSSSVSAVRCPQCLV